MGFENDVMISYAWKDNQPLPLAGSEGWVSGFHEGLEFWLKQVMPRNPRIWRDRNRMPGNKVFAEELDEVVQRTAVLLTVLSPPYMSSEWCARERENFVRAALTQGGLQVENDYRIFKINKFPVDRNTLPEELQVVTGFNFYSLDTETRQVEVIDPSLGETDKQQFYKRVYQVAVVLARMIAVLESEDAIRPGGQAGETETAPSEDDRRVVYLPYTTRDLREVREMLHAELVRRNCRVLPEQQYPFEDVEDFKAAAMEDLARAEFAIHLIGSRYGTIMEGADHSIVELQNLWAAEESKKRGLRRVIWMPREMGEVSENHAAFLDRLRTRRELLEGADLIEDTEENLKTAIMEMLEPKAEAGEERTGDDDDAFFLYVLYDDIDKDNVRELRRFFRKKIAKGKELKILRPVFDGEASELRAVHRQRLRDCDGVLLFWGDSSQAWLESSLSEVRKAPGFGREKPYKGKHLVYITREKDGPKEDWIMDFEDEFFDDDIDAVEAYDGVPKEKLDQFLETLT